VVAGLLAVLGGAAWVLLDRGLRQNVDVSLQAAAVTVATTSRDPAAQLGDALEALMGPMMAGRLYELLDPRGRPDPRLATRGTRLPLSAEALRNAEAGRETFETVELPTMSLRVLTMPIVAGGQIERLVQVAVPLDAVETARRRFLLILAGLAPLAILGAAAGGWWLAGRALAPVDAMVESARRITAEDLSQRVAVPPADDELGRLASGLNDMLARLERAFSSARRFSADAAHELRTPLTILKGEVEVALASTQTPDEYRRVLASAQEEVDRLAALVEDLLFLARADAGVAPPPQDSVDLRAVLDDAGPALIALAERGGQHLTVDTNGPVLVRGSAPLLLRVVVNLVDNAIKYTPTGGQVFVRLAAAGQAELTVRDTGPGIAADDQARVFDRFFRGDPARERGGTGLGLALTRSIVQLHGGRITVESQPGQGTCFRVWLPREMGATP
jgi:heavy metal sensor kinase